MREGIRRAARNRAGFASQAKQGGQDLALHRSIPVNGSIESRVRVADLYDKGKAGLVVLEVESSDGDGPLFTIRFSIFARGETVLSNAAVRLR